MEENRVQAVISCVNKLVRFRLSMFALFLACSQFCVSCLSATIIGIDLGHSPQIVSQMTAPLSGLNGTALQGQTLSLDLTFLNGEFTRLFTVTSNSFIALLTLQTNGSGVVGFLGGTGFLVDQQGNPLQQPQELGSASGNGSMAAGLLPLLSGGLQRPIDFFGIHLDLMLPADSSVSVTGGELALMSDMGAPFGVGPGVPRDIVPETGNTLSLLSLGLLGAVLGRLRLRQLS
jgi:hypothetical protein